MTAVLSAVSFARYSIIAFFACFTATCCVLLGLKAPINSPGKWQMSYFHSQAKAIFREAEDGKPILQDLSVQDEGAVVMPFDLAFDGGVE